MFDPAATNAMPRSTCWMRHAPTAPTFTARHIVIVEGSAFHPTTIPSARQFALYCMGRLVATSQLLQLAEGRLATIAQVAPRLRPALTQMMTTNDAHRL